MGRRVRSAGNHCPKAKQGQRRECGNETWHQIKAHNLTILPEEFWITEWGIDGHEQQAIKAAQSVNKAVLNRKAFDLATQESQDRGQQMSLINF